MWTAAELCLACALIWVLLWAAASATSVPDVGHEDGSYDGAGAEPTGSKPQSKLWFNDGLWWADMFDGVSRTWHIFRLDRAGVAWSDTGVQIDDRPAARADALWDGRHLYVATNVPPPQTPEGMETVTANEPARLFRYSYDAGAHRYVPDAGFPIEINQAFSETLTLDKDSRGVLWASWTQGQTVYVNSSDGSDSVWGTPFVPDVRGATGLSPDDLSSIAAFGGSRIGLMWSDQFTSTFSFAVHRDGDPRTRWTVRVALSQPGMADDHISLKQLEGDGQGHLFAAVKTSMDHSGRGTAPQTLLLSLDVDTGAWSSTVYGTVADCHTRPMIVIDRVARVVHMFATAPSSPGCPHAGTPGTIYEKTTSLDRPVFAPGRGTPVVRDVASADMNDVTGTKQNVTPATGLVILAGDDATHRYWHADIPLVAPTPTPTPATDGAVRPGAG